MSDDLPPPRGRLILRVAIATVLLTAIGVLGGLFLAGQDKANGGREGPVAAPGSSPVPPATDGRPACRAETQEMARRAGAEGTLKLDLVLRTRTSAVWICEDQGGRLFYHANRGGENGPWIERKTALFLDDVRRKGDAYAAVAVDGTVFSVNTERLLIVHKDGREEVQRAAG